jgi:sugar phosphate isomerase/epimerase
MSDNPRAAHVDRRRFLQAATAGLATAGALLTPRERALAQGLAEKARFERMAGCTWPIRSLFKTRQNPNRGGGAGGRTGGAPPAAPPAAATGRATATGPEGAQASPGVAIPGIPANRDQTTTAQMKQKYGEITLLEYPQWMKDNFAGLTRMDIYSGFFGDMVDDAMYFPAGSALGTGFDPLSVSGRKWLDALANTMVKTGTKVQHVSNNAPFSLADFGSPEADARRKAGVAMAKRWIEGCAVLAPVSMRMNSPQALGPSIRPNAIPRSGDGYPRNLEIVPLMNAAIESYKEMADFGGKYGVKVTFENHWGLAADPMNIRIMIDAVNHPYCDATPDFGNWEHEHMLFSGLKALAPYTSSNVHAKYWDRWGDANDVQRSVRIMMAAGFKGTFALEYESGPLNGVEGAKYLYKEVLAALTKLEAV